MFIHEGERQAQMVSFCARRVSLDRRLRLVQARLARAKKAVATTRFAGRLVASHIRKTRELAKYCGFHVNVFELGGLPVAEGISAP